MISTQPPVTSNPIWSMEDTAISEEEEEAFVVVKDTMNSVCSSTVGPTVTVVTEVLVADTNPTDTRMLILSKAINVEVTIDVRKLPDGE